MGRSSANLVRELTSPRGYARHRLGFSPYPKQAEVLDAIGPVGARVSLRSANEAGKTSLVATAAILWHLEMFPRGFVVSTAGAWRQVTHQLVPSLRRHQHRFPGWAFHDHSIRIGETDRYLGFSTNDAGKFEGYHGSAESPLMVIVDEAKTVKDEIFEAVDRCNPQRVLLLSSPGYAEGEFYRSHTSRSEFYRTFKIAASECPHITQESIEQRIAKWGPEHPLVRSMIFAEFMEFVENAVLSLTEWDRCLDAEVVFNEAAERHAFLDFAAGGDENVLAFRQGNRVRIVDAWRERDTMKAVGRFLTALTQLNRDHGLLPHEVEGDADGLGKPMCDAIRAAGWPILEFHGAAPPILDDHYANRISEVWFEGAQEISRCRAILPPDEDLKAQACSRKKWPHQKGLLQVEPKKVLMGKDRNQPSPDRADAVFGCLMPLPTLAGRQMLVRPKVNLAEIFAQAENRTQLRSAELEGCDFGA